MKINAKNVNWKTLFLFYIHQCFQSISIIVVTSSVTSKFHQSINQTMSFTTRRNNSGSTTTVKPFCKVCYDAGLSTEEFTSHFVKDQPGPSGRVVCPTLLAQKCLICGVPGHTSSYCPDNSSVSSSSTVQKEKEPRYALAADDIRCPLIPFVCPHPKTAIQTRSTHCLCQRASSRSVVDPRREYPSFPTFLHSVVSKMMSRNWNVNRQLQRKLLLFTRQSRWNTTRKTTRLESLTTMMLTAMLVTVKKKCLCQKTRKPIFMGFDCGRQKVNCCCSCCVKTITTTTCTFTLLHHCSNCNLDSSSSSSTHILQTKTSFRFWPRKEKAGQEVVGRHGFGRWWGISQKAAAVVNWLVS